MWRSRRRQRFHACEAGGEAYRTRFAPVKMEVLALSLRRRYNRSVLAGHCQNEVETDGMANDTEAKRRQAWWHVPRVAQWAGRNVRRATWLRGSTWSRAARAVPRSALDLVFPAACVSCRRELNGDHAEEKDVPLCGECRAQLQLLTGPACRRCGAPLPNQVGGCVHCRGRRHWFHAAIAAGRYAGRLRELVLRMKRTDRVSLVMGRLVWQCCEEQLVAVDADAVAAVPMHWRRRWAHGTNSAAVLAEILARKLRRPLWRDSMRRRRNTPPQFSLSPLERRANVRGAFSVRAGYPIEKAHVLLVDDIMTSGATCNEAARMLRKAGARRVTVVVAARAVSQ